MSRWAIDNRGIRHNTHADGSHGMHNIRGSSAAVGTADPASRGKIIGSEHGQFRNTNEKFMGESFSAAELEFQSVYVTGHISASSADSTAAYTMSFAEFTPSATYGKRLYMGLHGSNPTGYFGDVCIAVIQIGQGNNLLNTWHFGNGGYNYTHGFQYSFYEPNTGSKTNPTLPSLASVQSQTDWTNIITATNGISGEHWGLSEATGSSSTGMAYTVDPSFAFASYSQNDPQGELRNTGGAPTTNFVSTSAGFTNGSTVGQLSATGRPYLYREMSGGSDNTITFCRSDPLTLGVGAATGAIRIGFIIGMSYPANSITPANNTFFYAWGD
jgi:hypothetical protein